MICVVFVVRRKLPPQTEFMLTREFLNRVSTNTQRTSRTINIQFVCVYVRGRARACIYILCCWTFIANLLHPDFLFIICFSLAHVLTKIDKSFAVVTILRTVTFDSLSITAAFISIMHVTLCCVAPEFLTTAWTQRQFVMILFRKRR